MKKKYSSIIYQIWPRSFFDANNDGIGDIQGIISKLDYLNELGITHLWISPLYASPNKDYGYDVSNYYEINPEFGTMNDMKDLIRKARDYNIKIIMDLVANHTSTEHPWYIDAIKNPESKFRDYYFFREGKREKEPNNWISIFGGSAWTKVKNSTYVLTLFTPFQADLNWNNKGVRNEIVNVMEYWINLGIDGFRLDVINTISKIEGLPDKNPTKKGYQFADDFIINRPKAIEYAQEMMNEVHKRTNRDIITIGEGMLMNKETARKYSNLENPILDMMIHFDIHMLGCGPLGKFDFRKLYRWNTQQFKEVVIKWQLDMQEHNYWMANYLSNHDQPRHVSRFGNDKKYWSESAKALAILNFTLRGTPILYQGEEIGMTNADLNMEDWKDFESKNAYKVLQSMMHLPSFLAKKVISKMTRDHARTPMQWNNHRFAGFSKSKPWIKVNENYDKINVESQLDDSTSILSFYRDLISFVKTIELSTYEKFEAKHLKHKQILAYYRKDPKKPDVYFIVINLSDKIATFKQTELNALSKIIISNYATLPNISDKMVIRPYEAFVVKVEDSHES